MSLSLVHCFVCIVHPVHLQLGSSLAKCNLDEATPRYGLTPLHMASYLGFYEVVRVLIQLGASLEATTSYGETPLMFAVVRANTEVVKELVKAGANLNAVGEYTTPLCTAVEYGMEMVELLMGLGADVQVGTKHGVKPLHFALNEDNATVRLLLAAGATAGVLIGADQNIERSLLGHSRPSMPQFTLRVNLHVAALFGMVDEVESLSENGVNWVTRSDVTALALAAWIGNVEVVRQLLRLGAEADGYCDSSSIIGLAAERSGNKDVVQELLSAGAYIDYHAIHNAVAVSRDFQIVKVLLEHSRELTTEAILYAIACDRADMLKEVVESYGSNWNAKHGEYALAERDLRWVSSGVGETPIHAALLLGSLDVLRTLVSLGFSTNVVFTDKMMEGDYPLHYMARRGEFDFYKGVMYTSREDYFEILQELVSLGADINARNGAGLTPLQLADQYDFLEMQQMLLFLGAVADVGEERLSIIHRMVNANFVPSHLWLGSLEKLIKYGADVKAKASNTGETPLHLMAITDRYEGAAKCAHITALVSAGAEVDAVTAYGETPLQLAINEAEVKYLVETVDCLSGLGANTNFPTLTGDTPLHLILYRFDEYTPSRHEQLEALVSLDSRRTNFKTDNVVDVIKSLVKFGGHVDATGAGGLTPLQLLIKQGIKKPGSYRKDTLNYADMLKVAKAMVELGADVKQMTQDGETLVQLAKATYKEDGMEVLVDGLVQLGA